jgi:hypothetical protein
MPYMSSADLDRPIVWRDVGNFARLGLRATSSTDLDSEIG